MWSVVSEVHACVSHTVCYRANFVVSEQTSLWPHQRTQLISVGMAPTHRLSGALEIEILFIFPACATVAQNSSLSSLEEGSVRFRD